MPLLRAKSSFSAGLQIELKRGQDLLVAEGVWVQSADTHGIGARIGGQTIRIAGTVQAEEAAVCFGHLLDGEPSLTAQGRLTMIVERSGQLLSDSYAGARLFVEAADVINRGRIIGSTGFTFDNTDLVGLRDRAASTLLNSGLIIAFEYDAVFVQSQAAFRLVNTGKIVAMNSVDGLAIEMPQLTRFSLRNDGIIYGDIRIHAEGRFTNNGTLILPDGASLGELMGAVSFVNNGRVSAPGGGATTFTLSAHGDLYDGFLGVFRGTIMGASGNDRFLPGRGAETIVGGAQAGSLTEIDTLDFRAARAVRVDIENPAFNRGVAAGDSYQNIDVILGSNRGADFIIGGRYRERLVGNSGDDTLQGGFSMVGGQDTLHGGLGRDRLTGGEGDDTFYFRSPAERGDVIVDFSNTGQDDVLQIHAGGFGLTNLATGPLAAARFRLGATNRAGDADDRFIFDTRNDSLWFDRDGTGKRFDPVMIARFLGDPSFGANDIYILGL